MLCKHIMETVMQNKCKRVSFTEMEKWVDREQNLSGALHIQHRGPLVILVIVNNFRAPQKLIVYCTTATECTVKMSY